MEKATKTRSNFRVEYLGVILIILAIVTFTLYFAN